MALRLLVFLPPQAIEPLPDLQARPRDEEVGLRWRGWRAASTSAWPWRSAFRRPWDSAQSRDFGWWRSNPPIRSRWPASPSSWRPSRSSRVSCRRAAGAIRTGRV